MSTTVTLRAMAGWTGAPPGRWTIVLLAAGGTMTGVVLAALAYTSDGPAQPGLHPALAYWITIPYIAVGLIAWRHRPDSRLDVQIGAAGFASFLNFLIWSNNDGLFTLGGATQYLPPVLSLHVFLAFASGLAAIGIVAISERLLRLDGIVRSLRGPPSAGGAHPSAPSAAEGIAP
ncbi:MAG TPA: hypothetical protein VK923_07845 [Euzebyales bacterium]|nr:hypothetical protein [Euzebyales bacterium]